MKEEQLNAALAAWLDEPTDEPGQTQALRLAHNSGWASYTTDAQRAAFLAAYTPFEPLYAAAASLFEDVADWTGIDAIVEATEAFGIVHETILERLTREEKEAKAS
jgi:hypothetical protein